MNHLKTVSRVAPAALPISPINLRVWLLGFIINSLFGKGRA